MLDLRDAVLPFGARGPTKKVERSRLEVEGISFPFVTFLAAEPESAGGAERDADDIVEDRFVAMPADRCARGILCDKDVREVFRRKAGEGGSLSTKRLEEFGDILNAVERERSEVVSPTERNDPPFSGVAVELEFFEGEFADIADESGFFFRED